MNWVDLLAAGVVVVSGVVGLARGLVREVLGVGAWVGAALAAVYAFPAAEPVARQHIDDPTVAPVAAYAVPFVVALLVLWLAARMVSGVVRRSALGGLDRTLGLLFGFARGAVLLAFAYILVGTVQPVPLWPPVVLEARSLTAIYSLAAWTADQIPSEHRPAVAPPPAGRAATAEALLRAAPVGSALRTTSGTSLGTRSTP